MEPYDAGTDGCLSIFGQVYATGALVFPHQAPVLEIGCAEADWMTPMLVLRPDLQITGIDWRACERPGAVVHGDILTQDWPAESFDVVIGISSIEHIGLGHYDQDPLDAEGDRRCMARVARWLKPGGWIYADVPYGDTFHVVGTSHRVYSEAALLDRLCPRPLVMTRLWYGYDCDAIRETPNPAPLTQMAYVAMLVTKES